jgi:hypothetical protein
MKLHPMKLIFDNIEEINFKKNDVGTYNLTIFGEKEGTTIKLEANNVFCSCDPVGWYFMSQGDFGDPLPHELYEPIVNVKFFPYNYKNKLVLCTIEERTNVTN